MTNYFFFSKRNIYIFSLVLLIISLPTSKFLLSVAQFVLIGAWLLDKRVLHKFAQFFRHRAAMVVVSIFMIHVVGVLWSSDLQYAAKDLRIKLPLLALPIIISTSPALDRKMFFHLMVLFIATNVFSSLFSVAMLITEEVTEIRDIALFVSHIRFGLMLALAVFSGVFLFFQKDYLNPLSRWLILLATAWLLTFMVILQSVTGLGVLVITTMALLMVFVIRHKQLLIKIASVAILIAIPAIVILLAVNIRNQMIPDKPFYHDGLEELTRRGHPYTHDSTIIGFENGHWVGQYIQNWEMMTVWTKRSEAPYEGLDQAGNPLRFTLMRYLTSKGLRKDADGVEALTDEGIRAVEKGIASVNQLNETNLMGRLREVIWEIEIYRQSGYLSGHSVSQRLEFWRAGWWIVQENFLLGVGTGDIDNAFKEMYRKMDSQLPPEQWWRTHNQYLTVWATLGIFALIWFLFALIYPARRLNMFGDYFYFVFFCIVILSMITGDTLDTQAGVTFYAFFTCLLLFGRKEKDPFFREDIKTNSINY